MKKSTMIWLITAGALVLAGAVIFVSAMASVGWNLNGLGNTKYETKEYEVTDSFENLSIELSEEDIALVPSDDKKCKVVCVAREDTEHTVEVKDHTLMIGPENAEEQYTHFSLFLSGSPKVTVYLPQAKYNALTISGGVGDMDIPGDFAFKSIEITASAGDIRCAASSAGAMKIGISTGDIRVEKATADEMDLHVSTGKISMHAVSCKGGLTAGVTTGDTSADQVACKSFTSEGTTGDIRLSDVVAEQLISVERSTGDVTLEGCDGGELSIKTTTGDVNGTLLSEKVFITDTTTGDISVPKTTSGGKCEISTTTGDIDISIKE